MKSTLKIIMRYLKLNSMIIFNQRFHVIPLYNEF
jgi:hypothetical protein